MKLFVSFAALLCLLHLSTATINIPRANALFNQVKNTPIVKSNPALVEEVRKKVFVRGCRTNVCFALDGSGSVGDDFQTQKDFVKLIGAIVGADENSRFAATIYGLVNNNISKLTKNAEKFLLDVCDASFPAAKTTFISAGLGFCFNEMDNPKQQNDVNKIVLLGDGFSNFGDLTGPLAPVSVAQQWRNLGENNALCAVAVGFPSINALSAITGDRALVLEVTDWPILLNILDSLVENICFKEKVISAPCPCKCITKFKKGVKDGAKALKAAEKKCSKPKFSACKVTACGPKMWQCCN